jgi:hypothetical protein
MKLKSIIFALIAAGIGGAVSEAAERGLNAADERLTAKKATNAETETTTKDEDKTDE